MMAFNYMSEEAIAAICRRNDSVVDGSYADGTWKDGANKYVIELPRDDFRNMIVALAYYYHHGPENVSDEQSAENLTEWCGQFVSSIAETLDVEMI